MGYYDDPGRRFAPGPRRTPEERTIDKTLGLVRETETAFRGLGFELAADYLERYRHGVGGIDRWPWARLVSYDAARDADARVAAHFESWFTGGNKDSVWGEPFLNLADGETVTLGDLAADNGVRFEGEWYFADDTADIGRLPPSAQAHKRKQADFAYALGESVIRGFGEISFTRDKDRILVDGLVDFRFDEPYDYESNLTVFLGTLFSDDLPTVSGTELRRLAEKGPAKEFRTTAGVLRRVQGVIVLTDGKPDPLRSSFAWQTVSEGG